LKKLYVNAILIGHLKIDDAEWSSLVARRAHNPKVVWFKSRLRNQQEPLVQQNRRFCYFWKLPKNLQVDVYLMFKWTRGYLKRLEITGVVPVFFDVCLMFVELICGTFGPLQVGGDVEKVYVKNKFTFSIERK
jgi:hypothetical protein